jgi:hypothetical protein
MWLIRFNVRGFLIPEARNVLGQCDVGNLHIDKIGTTGPSKPSMVSYMDHIFVAFFFFPLMSTLSLLFRHPLSEQLDQVAGSFGQRPRHQNVMDNTGPLFSFYHTSESGVSGFFLI